MDKETSNGGHNTTQKIELHELHLNKESELISCSTNGTRRVIVKRHDQHLLIEITLDGIFDDAKRNIP